MIFVDTGFFIGSLLPDDALRARVVKWIVSVKEPLLTTEFVLIEVADALSLPRNRRQIEPFIAALRRNALYEIVPASPALFHDGLDLYARRSDKQWSLTDCISFALMQKRGISRALAFNHHFEQAGFEALLRREP